ncbi:MAG TPA: hypothetical protein VF659_08180 [Pyrinomonadaceae bacterium]|jgi:hypothetical protein
MTDSERRGRAPDGWTFAPLYAAVYIVGAYFVIYAAFVGCWPSIGAGCRPVSVKPLLDEIGACGRPAAQPPAAVAAPAQGPPPGVPSEERRRAAAYASRIPWLFLYATSILTALITLYTSAFVVWRSLREDFGARIHRAILAVAAVGVLAVAALRPVAEGNLFVLRPLMECAGKFDMTHAFRLVKWGNELGLFLAFALLLGSCATLWPVRKTPRQAVGVLAGRVRYLHTLLYVGMVALVLRPRAKSLITPGPGYTPAMGDEWLEKHGLDVTGSLKNQWPKLAAILAPLVAGSVGELFKGLGGVFF